MKESKTVTGKQRKRHKLWKPDNQLVAIHWVDSRSEVGWREESEFKDELFHILTVGFMVKDGKKVKVVASTASENQDKCGFMLIPTVSISSIKRLHELK